MDMLRVFFTTNILVKVEIEFLRFYQSSQYNHFNRMQITELEFMFNFDASVKFRVCGLFWFFSVKAKQNTVST